MSDAARTPIRAAQYLRMSTEHQKYSIDNQADAIKRYADDHGMEIVKTYADQGKSGVRFRDRHALKQLIGDVVDGESDYSTILVYDVSRWGRFQDIDEGAHLEFLCTRAGIKVVYCAEEFRNDGTITEAVLKSPKRAMAGEYSRELSVKVRNGQHRLARMGFHVGGNPGFGLRRLLVDENRKPKGILDHHQQKSIATDRVILVPGPPDEVNTVRRIYSFLVDRNQRVASIVKVLNAEGSVSANGRPWNWDTVNEVLTNEKYIGNNVRSRVYGPLSDPTKRIKNPPDKVVRREGAFAPIIDRQLFNRAQKKLTEQRSLPTREVMLKRLRQLYRRHGMLTHEIVRKAKNCPSINTYIKQFGIPLTEIFKLVGYEDPVRDWTAQRAINLRKPMLVAETTSMLTVDGTMVRDDSNSCLLTVDETFRAAVVAVPAHRNDWGSIRWRIWLTAVPKADVGVFIRIAPNRVDPQDYYVLPLRDFATRRHVLTRAEDMPQLASYRVDSADRLAAMVRRCFAGVVAPN